MTIGGGVGPGVGPVPRGQLYGVPYPTLGIPGLSMDPTFGRVPGDGAVAAPNSPMVAPTQAGIPGGVGEPRGGSGGGGASPLHAQSSVYGTPDDVAPGFKEALPQGQLYASGADAVPTVRANRSRILPKQGGDLQYVARAEGSAAQLGGKYWASIPPWWGPGDWPHAGPIEKPTSWDAILEEIRRVSDPERAIRHWRILWAGVMRRVWYAWAAYLDPFDPPIFDTPLSHGAIHLVTKLHVLEDDAAMDNLSELAAMALGVEDPGEPTRASGERLLDLVSAVVACTLSWYGMARELWKMVKERSPEMASTAALFVESIPRTMGGLLYAPESEG